MKKPSDIPGDWEQQRKKIIGLGESSIRKSYYPELQNRLSELERINFLVENSPVVLFSWKAAEGWPVEFVSKNIIQFGYHAESFISGERSYISIIFHEDLDRVAKEVNFFSDSGADHFDQEYRIVTADGAVRWVDDRTVVVRDEKGVITHYHGIIIDITEKKKITNELQFTQFAVEKMSDQAIWLTEDGCNFYVNDAVCRALGYTRDELLSMKIFDIIQVTQQEYRDYWCELIKNGSVSFESFNRSKNGLLYPVEVRANYVVFDGKEYNCSFVTDISERKKAESLLKESEQKFSAIFDNSPMTMTLMKLPEGIFIEVNRAFSRMYGLTRDEVIGNTDTELGLWAVAEDRGRYLDALEKGNGSVHEMEFLMRRNDGTLITVLFSGDSVEIGGMRFILNAVQDISERKRSESQLSYTMSLNSAVLESTPDAILVVNMEGQISQWNRKFVEIFQVPDELLVKDTKDPVLGYVTAQMADPDEFLAKVIYLYAHPEESSVDTLMLSNGRIIERYSQPQKIGDMVVGRFWSFRDITEQKKIEQSIIELNRKNEDAFKVARMGRWEFDTETGYYLFSDQFYTIIGTTADEMGGYLMSLDDYIARFIPAEIADGIRMSITLAVESDDPDYQAQAETKVLRKDGVARDVVVWFRGEKDNSGKTRRLIGVIQDITERKYIENTLRETEFFLNHSQEIAGIGSYTLNIASLRWISSPSLDTIFGISPDFERDVNGWMQIILPEDREMMQGHLLNHVIKEKNRFDKEYRIRRPDNGETRWMHGLGELEYDSTGNPVRMIGTIQDVTERKAVEKTLLFLSQVFWLNTENDFLQALLRYLSEILFVEYAYIAKINEDLESVKTLLFLESGESKSNIEYFLKGTPCENVIIQDIASFKQDVKNLFPNDSVLKEIGAEGYAGVSLRDSRGVPIGLIVVISKKPLISESLVRSILQLVAVRASGELERKRSDEEQARLREQLFQSQKMESVGLLAGGVAHDFNNLLTPILGYTELMLLTLGSNNPDYQNLLYIKQSAERAKDLTHRLLAFSRKQMLELRVVSLGEIIHQFENVLSRTIRENIHIKINVSCNECLIRADKGQIEQVILNLCINAQDAMPDGGSLEIEARDIELDESYTSIHPEIIPGEYIMLSVTDTGEGMSPEVIEHIFEPFFTSKEAGKGTGLGLATVYGIVKQHGGSVSVYSEINRGSIFKVFFPRVVDCDRRIENIVNQPHHIEHGKETVLIVEDNEIVRKFTSTMIESLGYNVLEADDVDRSVDIADRYEGKIDILLTDVIMPKLNGRELFSILEKKIPGLKVLYMSGYSRDVIGRNNILDVGIHFIQKPFSVHSMSQKLREVLDE